ncbi:MAG: spore coat associated protein CotJA [Firmicutes bacterium]|nr:spore coat associated protein CotJA [Bacillota bacterium]
MTQYCHSCRYARTHSTDGKRLAQAYVPTQAFRELYSDTDALRFGTVFKELHQPYKK